MAQGVTLSGSEKVTKLKPHLYGSSFDSGSERDKGYKHSLELKVDSAGS